MSQRAKKLGHIKTKERMRRRKNNSELQKERIIENVREKYREKKSENSERE